MSSTTRLVDDGLFVEVDGSPRLRGSQCRSCGVTTFPVAAGCPQCTGQDLAEVALPEQGHLWSWTAQRFEPKTPYRGLDDFAPYGVGYVNLGSVIVESRLLGDALAGYTIGSTMQLRVVPAFEDEDGTTVMTYAFEALSTVQEG